MFGLNRWVVVIGLLLALPLQPAALVHGSATLQPLRHLSARGVDVPSAPNSYAWYDGLIRYSTITNCASIIQGFPYQENGAGTYVGFLADLNAGQPALNTPYYVHVVVYGLGNSCSGQRAYIDVQLPADTSLAIDATNQVRCYNQQGLMGGCPQTFQASVYNPGAYYIPSGDEAHANTWPIPQGNFIEIQIPVRSTTALNNSPFQANVWMLDGNSSPWLRPQQGIYVFSSQPAQPTINYPIPSTITVTTTSAHSEAYLYTYGTGGTGHFELGTTTSYGFINEAVPIAAGYTAWVAWDEWGPPVLTPDTFYHWRFTFTPSGGSTVYGADQTFRTLPDGQVTVGDGGPASCANLDHAVDNALDTAKEILFNCGVWPNTITLSKSHSIGSNLTINGGNKVTLRRQNDGLGNFFNVQAGAHLTLTQITLSNGTNTAACGGAIKVFSGAQLTLNETRFIANKADGQGGALCNWGSADISATLFMSNTSSFSHGGAIGNYGSLRITNSKFMSNTAYANGGSIDMGGIVTVTNSTFVSNTAGYRGGGINSYGGTLTIVGSSFINNTGNMYGGGVASDASLTTASDTTFSDNHSPNNGGGLENSGALTLTNSTLSTNTVGVGGRGGGVYNDPSGKLIIDSSTLVDNSAPGGFGGGIYNVGQLTLNAATLAGNAVSAGLGGGIYDEISGTAAITNSTFYHNFGGMAGGGILAVGAVTVTNSTFYSNTAGGLNGGNSGKPLKLKNSIVVNNSAYNCNGTITSLGHNLESADTCAFAAIGDLHDVVNPQLDPLANNGGPTLTDALLLGSPAIDAGTNSGCPLTDQRGVARPQDGDGNGTAVCDIGAYEAMPTYRVYLPSVMR